MKSENDGKQAITILKDSRHRLKEAIKKGEPTAFFSEASFPPTMLHQQLKKLKMKRTNTALWLTAMIERGINVVYK